MDHIPASLRPLRVKEASVDERVATVVSLIRDRPAITITELAVLVNLSPSRLRHLFHADTGLPPYRYVRQQRLLVARRLLKTTFMSLKQVGVASGFRDTCHFVREFRRTVGVPPAAYRSSAVFDNE